MKTKITALLHQINEETAPKGKDPRKIAKRIFMELLDPEIIEGGLENLRDVTSQDETIWPWKEKETDEDRAKSLALDKEVTKIVKEFITKTKAFIKTLK